MTRKTKRSLWIITAILSGAVLLYRGDVAPLAHVHPRASTPTFSPETFYPVTRVVDGDTLDVLNGGQEVRLRLIGINTPETVDPRKPVECFGLEASARAKVLLSGRSVRVDTDSTQDHLDKYGRTLAYVTLPDGTSFNEEMIAEGYAHEYTYHYPYKYQTEFKAAERSAREAGRGLWAPGTCDK